MAGMWFPQQGWIDEESKRLAAEDIGESDRDTGEDQYAHAPGKVCKDDARSI
jgi:hypothetical protein